MQVTCPKSSHKREGPVVNSSGCQSDREGSSMRRFRRNALLAAEGARPKTGSSDQLTAVAEKGGGNKTRASLVDKHVI
jgi:hypothetical protein